MAINILKENGDKTMTPYGEEQIKILEEHREQVINSPILSKLLRELQSNRNKSSIDRLMLYTIIQQDAQLNKQNKEELYKKMFSPSPSTMYVPSGKVLMKGTKQ